MDAILDLDSDNILVTSGASADSPQRLHHSLVHGESTASLVGVALAETPDAWLEKLERQLGDLPPEIILISVGDRTRSASSSASIDCERAGSTISIRSVKSPQNLTELGVALTNAFADIETARTGLASLCFEDLATLLLHTDEETAFRFFNVLTDHVRAAGIRGHYHLNTDAVSDETYHVIRLAFNAQVTITPSGDVETERIH